eukprot:CAMPEP_0184705416 /NCGR_PEP_ID=MMETSP0313-20130426/34289_1 /TAXON_ID=2792 /ORGANISM="Porphyridium aerugineum, Strain SAG 1380-2" /LENGTH=172 /DNA_ID=CAMNT_0027166757 /DNA_START=83 /DNA_END=601 /DNA_ORIENTATION=-
MAAAVSMMRAMRMVNASSVSMVRNAGMNSYHFRQVAVANQRRFFSSENPADCKYSKSHEWVKPGKDGIATVGITAHAAGELGDIVFVDLPEKGTQVTAAESFGAVESVKAASDIYSPISGEVVEINSALSDEPGTVNKDAFGTGWMIKVKMSNQGELNSLMDSVAYTKSYEE